MTFILIHSGYKIDAIIASYAHYKKLPIIQFGQNGVVDLGSIVDHKEKVEAFAKIIQHSTKVYFNDALKPRPTVKVVTPNKAIDLDSIGTSSKKTRK